MQTLDILTREFLQEEVTEESRFEAVRGLRQRSGECLGELELRHVEASASRASMWSGASGECGGYGTREAGTALVTALWKLFQSLHFSSGQF